MYDLIIVGSGCVGYSAAIYAGRLGLKTLLIGEIGGGMIISADSVENYPGFTKISGTDLTNKLKQHALQYKIKMLSDIVLDIKKEKNCFKVSTKNKTYISKTIILATGTTWKKLNVPGEKEFKNRGVHHCALCDGYIYKNKVIAVIGGSDSAAKEALVLSRLARKVYIIYRGKDIRPEPINLLRIKNAKNIEIISSTNVTKINGNKFVSSVKLDKKYKKNAELKLDAVFIAIGHLAKSDLAKKLCVKLNKRHEIIIDRESKTNMPGLFAAGDVADTRFKQAITGVGEAVKAAYSAYQHITNAKKMPCSDEE